MLHSNRELFEQAILRTADATGIAASIIEKDYYVTEFLRRMTSYQPDMVFKGGTSLSKCYKLIQRFSEDIDLNVEDRPSEGQRKALKRNILAVVDDLGLSLSNAEEIRSGCELSKTCGSGGEAGCRGGAAGFTHDEGNVR